MHVNTCSACHPFFTGQAAYVDSEGRIEQFRKRYAKKGAAKEAAPANEAAAVKTAASK